MTAAEHEKQAESLLRHADMAMDRGQSAMATALALSAATHALLALKFINASVSR